MSQRLPHQLSDDLRLRCLGIGIGPANLSLASLLHGHREVPHAFVERSPSFGWHDGQQTGATLQVSMLKDLVSAVDPTNRTEVPALGTATSPPLGRAARWQKEE